MSRIECARARRVLRGAIPDGRPTPAHVRSHVDRCLRCGAVQAREQALARAMRGLAGRIEPVPGDLEHRVMAAIGGPSPAGPRRQGPERLWRPVAVAAAVAVGVVLARRRLSAPA